MRTQKALGGLETKRSVSGDQVDKQVQPCMRLGTGSQAASPLRQGCLEMLLVGVPAQGMPQYPLVVLLSLPHHLNEEEP